MPGLSGELESLRAENTGLNARMDQIRPQRDDLSRQLREIHGQRDDHLRLVADLEQRNGDLRSQNRRFKENARTLVTELKGAWWLKAADAYAHLEALLREDLDP